MHLSKTEHQTQMASAGVDDVSTTHAADGFD
jgi:hypothetical protein